MISDYEAELHFELGGESFSLPFKIECPDQQENEDFHEITKNGHAVKTKARNQQYYCKSCHKYFYANTSRFFIQFETKIKQRIEYHLMNGNLKNFDLAKLCNWSISGAGRILDKILEEIGDKVPYIRETLGKIHLKIVFMDETFLKIKDKTWYLIMAISETGIILGAELKEHRDQETLIRMMHEIEKQLDTPIPIFASDGLSTYKGVALALHHDLIHVRHIHAPPYGRIEIDAIKLLSTPGKVEVTTISTMNDIFQNGGVFLARVQRIMVSTLNPPPEKRGRKKGGKNRPKEVINAEKQQKEQNPGKRGRPKKKKDNPVFVFKLDKGNGCIQPWGEGDQDAANILTSLYHVFEQKCITTNPIEKEFSAFKIFICFRGRRSLARWQRLVRGYCWIRNNPFIIKELLRPISLSGIAIKHVLIHQLVYGVVN